MLLTPGILWHFYFSWLNLFIQKAVDASCVRASRSGKFNELLRIETQDSSAQMGLFWMDRKTLCTRLLLLFLEIWKHGCNKAVIAKERNDSRLQIRKLVLQPWVQVARQRTTRKEPLFSGTALICMWYNSIPISLPTTSTPPPPRPTHCLGHPEDSLGSCKSESSVALAFFQKLQMRVWESLSW